MNATGTSLPCPPGIHPRSGVAGPLQRILTTAGIILALAIVVFTGSHCFPVGFQANRLGAPSSLAPLLAAWLFSIIWHETGHLLASLATGFDVSGFAVGPVRAYRSTGIWQFRLDCRNVFAASVSAFPRHSGAWRQRMLIVVAAGPFMTLLAAAVSIAFASGLWMNKGGTAFWVFAAEFNLLLFVAGLVPNGPAARVRNDAMLFVSLWKNGSAAEEILRYHLLLQLRRDEIRPRLYPAHLIRELARPCERGEFAVLFGTAVCECALDLGIPILADEWDAYAVSAGANCQSPWSDMAFAHSAFLDFVHRRDYASADDKLRRVTMAKLMPLWLKHRSTALLQYMRSDVGRAERHLTGAENCFKRRTPYAEFQIGLLQTLRAEAHRWLRSETGECVRETS